MHSILHQSDREMLQICLFQPNAYDKYQRRPHHDAVLHVTYIIIIIMCVQLFRDYNYLLSDVNVDDEHSA
jgi:hypothetical protein